MLSFQSRFRRTLLAGLALCALSQPTVFAQSGVAPFPDRPVKIVVPFAPGAGTDAMGRRIAQKLGEVLSASFVVENRTGASGAIGTQYVAQQAADGYTLLLVASPFTTVAASLTTAGYDPIKSFTPVGMIASGPLVWAANNQLPANTMQELVALARQKPGVLNYGSAGAGGVNHLVLELLKAKTGTFITHIPYRGVAPAAVDMVAGEVQLVTGTIPALLPLIKDKRIKPLAVTTVDSISRLPLDKMAVDKPWVLIDRRTSKLSANPVSLAYWSITAGPPQRMAVSRPQANTPLA